MLLFLQNILPKAADFEQFVKHIQRDSGNVLCPP